MLSERKLEIIRLIHNTNLEIEEIAAILNVSTRTVRRDLINIIEVVQEMGYTVEKNKTSYKIIDEDSTIFETINIMSANDYITEEKLIIGLIPISEGENTIDIETVANELFVTGQSLKTIICQFLDDYNIVYAAKGTHVTLSITDIQRRELLIAVLREYIATVDINSIVLDATIQSNKIRNHDIIAEYIDLDEFDRMFISIENIFNESNRYVTDFQLIIIVLTVCVSMTQSLRTPISFENKSIISDKIIEQIITESGIVSIDECNYLAAKLESTITELEYEKVNLTLIAEISNAISEVENQLSIKFGNRRKLEYQVCTHYVRATNNGGDIYLNNNISLRQFVIENQFLLEILRSIKVFNKNDEEKLYYLLIYFVMALEETLAYNQWIIYVICFGGVGTSLMIKKQLEKEYPNSKIQNLSYARALSTNLDEADLIISNSKLPNDLQNMVVGHIINKHDIRQINTILLSKGAKKRDISNVDDIYYNIGFKPMDNSYTQATKEIVYKYADDNVLTDSEYIFQKLRKREQNGVGIPGSKIAFFHTRSSSVKNLIIATYTVNNFETIGFDGAKMESNKILLVLVPVDVSDEVLEKVNILSYSLISDPNLLHAIEVDDYQKIHSIMQK